MARVNYQSQTGGGPQSTDDLKPWELQVRDTLPRASVHGILGGIDTEINDSECVQTNESTVRNYISFGSPTVDREESPTPVDTSSDVLTKRPRSREDSIQSGALDIEYDGPSQNGYGVNKRPNSKRDGKQPMKKKKTAEDVHQIQYAVLEKQLEKHTLQIKLLEKLILKYENDDTLAILSVFEQ